MVPYSGAFVNEDHLITRLNTQNVLGLQRDGQRAPRMGRERAEFRRGFHARKQLLCAPHNLNAVVGASRVARFKPLEMKISCVISVLT